VVTTLVGIVHSAPITVCGFGCDAADAMLLMQCWRKMAFVRHFSGVCDASVGLQPVAMALTVLLHNSGVTQCLVENGRSVRSSGKMDCRCAL